MITHRQEAPREPGGADLISYGRAGMLSALDDGLGALESGLDSMKEMLPDEFDPQALADGIVEELADATLRPLMVSAIGMIGFVLLFSILSIIANILLSTLGIVNHLPVVGPINALLGGAVGVLEGVLLVWVFASCCGGCWASIRRAGGSSAPTRSATPSCSAISPIPRCWGSLHKPFGLRRQREG